MKKLLIAMFLGSISIANATTYVNQVPSCDSAPKATCGNSFQAVGNNRTGCKWHDTESKCRQTPVPCKISGTSCSD